MGPGHRYRADQFYSAIENGDTRLTKKQFVDIIKDVYKELVVTDYGSAPSADAAGRPTYTKPERQNSSKALRMRR